MSDFEPLNNERGHGANQFQKLGVCVMGNIDFGFYLSILLRRLPYLIAITIVALLAAIAATRLISPVYSSSAKILSEAPQIPADLARSTVPLSAVEQLQILQQQITTRDDLLALATRLAIYNGTEKKPLDDDIVKDMLSRIKFEQLQFDTPSRDQGATVFSVSFLAGKADMAAQVANELAAMILDRNQRQRTDRAGSTLQFFDQTVARLSSDLNTLETDILAFKTKNKDTLPESLDFRRSQQGSLQERLIALQREESDLHTKRGSLIATYTNTGQLVGSVPLTPEQQILADLNRALAEQLALFSETSPNIKALRARITALQNELVSSPSQDAKNENSTPAKQAAPFGLDLQLSDIDTRLKAVAVEKASVIRGIEDLTRSITGTAASETVLNSLERNRQNIQMQYNAAIARRAEALTGEQIEMRSDGGRFSLLESATPPVKAISPQRTRIVGLGGMAGLGLGLAVIVLLEMLNKTIRRPVELAQLLQSQPLATIPNIRTSKKVRFPSYRRRMAAMLAVGMMPLLFIAVTESAVWRPLTNHRIIQAETEPNVSLSRAEIFVRGRV
ncbi:GumC family protein [Pararhizobium sp.]|uniref:GumC family protein n=1 Tax=Pararhizobium sp. TaxID=1977563 RepID=UPI003D0B53AA